MFCVCSDIFIAEMLYVLCSRSGKFLNTKINVLIAAFYLQKLSGQGVHVSESPSAKLGEI